MKSSLFIPRQQLPCQPAPLCELGPSTYFLLLANLIDLNSHVVLFSFLFVFLKKSVYVVNVRCSLLEGVVIMTIEVSLHSYKEDLLSYI